MGRQKILKVHNKSDKPDNVVMKEQKIIADCEDLQRQLPKFMAGYFAYLKGNVLPMTRRAYLQDVLFFCKYLINDKILSTYNRERDYHYKVITLIDKDIKQYEKIKKQVESGKLKFTDKCKDFEKNATSYKSGSTKYTTAWDVSDEEGKKNHGS